QITPRHAKPPSQNIQLLQEARSNLERRNPTITPPTRITKPPGNLHILPRNSHREPPPLDRGKLLARHSVLLDNPARQLPRTPIAKIDQAMLQVDTENTASRIELYKPITATNNLVYLNSNLASQNHTPRRPITENHPTLTIRHHKPPSKDPR
ncbi:MAG: hypothetical protein GSR72_04770, partial [Desulfurococcales archaeon]|nr:hypothetical protein [Desulfurococcales archaeon]